MQMHFYKNNESIKKISITNYDDLHYNITDDDVNMEIVLKPEVIITRENKEYYFKLDITNNTCIYKLKEYNLTYDIEILSKNYLENDQEIIIEYQLNTDQGQNKIIIKKEDTNEGTN